MSARPYIMQSSGVRSLIAGSMVAILGLIGLAPSPVNAAAPPVISQLIYAGFPIEDEFGNRLRGTDPAATQFGLPAVEGDLVQVYLATDGQIYPPDAQGQPDPRNTLLMETRIGHGAAANDSQPGIFSATVTPRPAGGSIIFVRVFNAPSLAQSSFYQDSQLFTVSWSVNNNFQALFRGGPILLDGGDNDGDGVINSWEISYGTNPDARDTDLDSQSDSEELIAGTDPLQSTSHFAVVTAKILPPDQLRLSWDSELNRIYTVQRRLALDSEAIFTTVGSVNGNGASMDMDVPAEAVGPVVYRVLVEQISQAE